MGLIVVKPKEFDVTIRPVRSLLTVGANGAQYASVVTNQTTTYKNLFDIDSDTYFPTVIGKLAWVEVFISFDIMGGSNTPVVTYKLEADNKGLDTWTIMSAEETYTTTTSYINKAFESLLKITANLVDTAPLSIRLQFKSGAATANDLVSIKLKNDTYIRLVGTYNLE